MYDIRNMARRIMESKSNPYRIAKKTCAMNTQYGNIERESNGRMSADKPPSVCGISCRRSNEKSQTDIRIAAFLSQEQGDNER